MGPRTAPTGAGWPAICSTGGFSIILAFLVFCYGGVLSRDWNIAACGIAAISIGLALFPGRGKATEYGPGRHIAWLMALLCAYIAFQTIPLPGALVAVLSPARFELTSATRILGDTPGFMPLSVFPSATLAQLSNFLCYLLVFVSVCNLTKQKNKAVWFMIAPLVFVGTGEAIAGLIQAAGGGAPHFAHGTYVNKNHFAGFLEMIVAFPIAYGWHLRGSNTRTRTVLICALAVIIAAAICVSTSRSGILSAALAVMVTISVISAKKPLFYWAAAAAGVALVAAILFLIPIEAVDSVRPAIWRDSLHLIRDFPITGSGLGTFETALFRYKTAAPLYTVDYAHNDYLQFLAELGLTGLLMLAAIGVGTVWKAISLVRTARAEQKALASAGLGAFAAIALHSLTDFNLYIPANALTLVWIAAVVWGMGTTES